MSGTPATPIIMASKSSARLSMMAAAGVDLQALAANIDEQNLIDGLRFDGVTCRDIADALAEAKAQKISRKHPTTLVLGCDQMLQLDDGSLLSKAETAEQAKTQLSRLSGQRHRLFSAAVFCEAGQAVWRHIDSAALTMRPLSAGFIDDYVSANWDEIQRTVGCYQIEACGIQLFHKIEGNHFTILGMPLLAVLDYLRIRGNLPS